jgi:hypothetical protein
MSIRTCPCRECATGRTLVLWSGYILALVLAGVGIYLWGLIIGWWS